ncbi:hypothetical protein ACFLZ8_04170 [Planctomycetota bacterium]
MKKQIIVCTIVLLAAVALSQAQEPTITGKVDLTYTSKYVWRGFNVFGTQSAIHPTVNLFMPSTSMGFSVEGHRANSSGYEIIERWDYSLYYLGRMFVGEDYEMNYRLAYVYYNYPQQSSSSRGSNPMEDPGFCLDDGSFEIHEGHVVMSFPKILPIEGLVPTYCLVKLAPVNSGTIVGANSPSGGTASGFAHIFMFDYAMPFTCPFTGVDRDLNLHSEFVFNDGVSPVGTNADHDWSNAVFGASTSYEIEENVNLTPGIFYQSSWDDSVNSSDEYWVSLGASYDF